MQRRPRPSRRLQLSLAALSALAFLTAQIALAAPPSATFTISDSTPVRGQTVGFDAAATDPDGDAISSYEWDFGDGATGSGQNVTHAYAGLGPLTVRLRVTDATGETTTVTDQLTVQNRPPTASISVSNTAPARGQLIGFDATATDPDGDALSYAWDFGDGTTATGRNVSHAYSATTSLGAKTVTLTVTDSANETTVATQQLTVRNAPPTASFTVSDDTPVRGQTVNFNATASDFDGEITSFQWAFGDGTTASGRNVTHAYPATTSLGAKTVTLTVTDSANETAVSTQQLTLQNAPPTASFSISDPTPARGQTVSFDVTATDPDGDIASYHWNFGDGTTSNGQDVTHAYPAATSLGAKTVTLTVTDGANQTAVVSHQLTVQNAPPKPAFSVSDPTPDVGQTVSFNGSASSDFEGSIADTDHDWDLNGDGSFERTGKTQTGSYTTPGPVTVRLQVTDSNGAKEIATQTIVVNDNAAPTAVMTVSHVDKPGGVPGVLDVGETVTFDGSRSGAGEPSDTISGYAWDLDGDGAFERTGVTQSHSYTTPGPVTVRLQVTDSNRATNTETKTITVNANTPPTAGFAVSHVNGAGGTAGVDVGETVTFNGSASDPGEPSDTIARYEWDLDGNGTFETTGQPASRSYAASGPVTVTLRVTDAHGATDTATETITVTNTPPTASFTRSHVDRAGGGTGVDIGETVTFNASASNPGEAGDTISRYEWDLDGNPSTGPGGFEVDTGTSATTSRTFTTPGSVTVRLRVTDANGATHTASQAVAVSNATPSASFTITPVDQAGGAPGVADVGETVNFNGSASNPGEAGDSITKYEWDLDGNPSTGPGGFEVNTGTSATISRTYATHGSVTVRLRVTDGANATNVASKPDLTINARPVARIDILNPQAEAGQQRAVPLAGQGFTFTGGATPPAPGAAPAPGCTANPGAPGSPGSTDADGSLTYHWDFDGDESFNDATGQEAAAPLEHYPAGERTVALRVVDSKGASERATLTFRVNRPPAPGFVMEPSAPVIGQQVTFSTTSGDPDAADSNLTHSWDLDADGTYCEAGEQGTSVKRVFSTPGLHTVKLRVTDTGGITREVTREVLVQNTVPTGSMTFSPEAPLPGQSVTFDGSGSSPTGKTITPLEWNFDFDAAGFDPATDQFVAQATGASVAWSFATAGPRTVALKISEVGGGFQIVTRTIVVNAPPQANFSISDRNPFTGARVALSSISQDPDGPLAAQEWDLDNDGLFDDAAGAAAFATFATPGSHTVRLRVTDSKGASATAAGTVTVRVVPPPPPPPPPPLLQGVVVRIKGSVLGGHTKVKRLLVRAPQGANVLVRCRGKSCPKKASQASRLSMGRQLRFKQLERRMRPGTRIIVRVTKPGFVGRATTFSMRKGAAPKRADLCLPPGAKTPTSCPGW